MEAPPRPALTNGTLRCFKKVRLETSVVHVSFLSDGRTSTLHNYMVRCHSL